MNVFGTDLIMFWNFLINILLIKEISNFNYFSKHSYIYYLYKIFYMFT